MTADEDDDQGGEGELPAGPVDAFRDLETTRRLAVEAAHQTIAKLALLPHLSEAGARQLRALVGVINDAEELEIRRYIVMGKLGGKGEPAGPPDVEGARRIAAGEEKG